MIKRTILTACFVLFMGDGAFAQSQQIYDKFADQIISDLSASSRTRAPQSQSDQAVLYFKKTYASIYGKKQRIAIWPFQKNKIPIAKDIADGFNDHLLAALLRRAGGRFEFVARDTLKAIIDDLAQTGGLDAGDDPIAALMERARDIDVLVTGRMRLTEQGLSLGYKAVRVDGTIISQTDRQALPLQTFERTQPDDLLTLDQAVKAAAKSMADQLSAIEEIRAGGVRYQLSGLQPPFGRYLQERMLAGLQNNLANPLTGRVIRLTESRLSRKITGARVEAKEMSDKRFTANRASYLFSGSYWLLDNAIDLRFVLRNSKGKSVAWTGRVRPDSVGGLALRPKGDFGLERENDGLGPFDFQLTSVRGKDPIYRIGDNLNLLVRVGEPAWVYCFYHQADGKIIQIFPNPHFWQRLKEPRLAAAKVHTIPGNKMFPFDLTLSRPTGRELVKCFAATRDVTQELPERFRGLSLSPISKKQALGLSQIFRQLPFVAVNEASLVITVLEKGASAISTP